MTLTREQQQDALLVILRLAGEWYGLDVHAVREVMAWQPWTSVRRKPGLAVGTVHPHGTELLAVDLSGREQPYAAGGVRRPRLVLLSVNGTDFGLVADEVSQVLQVPGDQIEAPAAPSGTVVREFVCAAATVDERVVYILDAHRISAALDTAPTW